MPLPWQTPFSRSIVDPRNLPGLSLWIDSKDVGSQRNDAGNVPANSEGIKLWADKSGNSGVNVLCLDGAVGNYASAPDSVPLSITGDIDVRCNLMMVDWTPGASTYFISKWVTTGNQRSYVFGISTSGTLELSWSADGTAAITKLSTVAVSFTDRTAGWIRATLDVDNGAAGNDVIFYTSTDGVTWVQLGTTVTTAGTTSIFNSTAVLNLGQINGDTNRLAGNLHRCTIYSGIAGTVAFDANFATFSKLAASGTESSSNAATVTINTSGATGARISGARDLYQGTAANQPILLQHSGTNYGYLNGVSGNFYETPDSAAVSVTGDIDVRWFGSLTSVSTTQVLVSKNRTAGQRSYELYLNGGGFLTAIASTDGTTIISGNSTAHGVSAGTSIWFRFTRASATGLFSFFKSTDGSSWTAIGTAAAASGTIFDGTDVVRIGASTAGSFQATGNMLRAQIYNGIAGTLAFDFNPAAYTSGTTFLDSSANAATITLNGGAAIVTKSSLYFDGSNDYLKAAAFALSQPETVYFVGSQVTWTNGDVIWSGGVNGAGTLYQDTTTPNLSVYPGTTQTTANSGLSLQTDGIVTCVVNGTNSLVRINRGAPTTGGSGGSAPNGFTLASNGNGGVTPANITAQEVLVYDRAHDKATQDRVILYLSRKWGIAA